MSWPDAAALIHYARLMNGTCPDCGCILPHRDSDVTHECPLKPAPVQAQEELAVLSEQEES